MNVSFIPLSLVLESRHKYLKVPWQEVDLLVRNFEVTPLLAMFLFVFDFISVRKGLEPFVSTM